MNPYLKCPTITTESFIIRLVKASDRESLFQCYHDPSAVRFMNEDNCDFGFFVESCEKMSETISYWLDFYQKKCFIRFAIVDRSNGKAVGTVEGFGGETGVLRLDLASAYEKESYLSELFCFVREHFHEFFGNESLVTKAVPEAVERRQALKENGWEYIDSFRDYKDYYRIDLIG